MKLFNHKYRFFKKKLLNCQEAIWENDFKVAKSRQIREGVRQDRDRIADTIHSLGVQLKTETDKKKKSQLEESIKAFEDTKKRYEAQMKMVDDEINGVPASENDPGREGINDRIKAYAELREMYKSYLKSI